MLKEVGKKMIYTGLHQ